MASAALAFGCDLGDAKYDPARGPALHVIATYPADGQGSECAPDSAADCGVPPNTTIELRLDRFLNPATPVRQAIVLYTGDPEANRIVDFEPEYDLVERVVVYRFRDGFELQPRTLYRVEIVVPTDEEGDGLRAFDGAPLEPGPVPLSFSFMTGETPTPAPEPPKVFECGEVVKLLNSAGCSATGCHYSAAEWDPRVAMDLSSPRGLVLTALDQVAHETDLGPSSGVSFDNPSRMGVNMARILRHAPESSYLLYKVLRDPLNFRASVLDADPCDPDSERRRAHNVTLPEGTCFAPNPDETERLREWFVRGEAMPIRREPRPGADIPRGLDRGQLRTLQTWIRAGAPCL